MFRLCLVAAVLGCLTIAALAQEARPTIDPYAKATGSNAISVDGVAVVPVRVVAAWLKATVTFDSATRAITMAIPEQSIDADPKSGAPVHPRVVPACTVVFTIGSAEVTVDGRTSPLSSPAVSAAGACYVPARGLLDALNAGEPKWLFLGWDNAAPGVVILQQRGFLHEKLLIPAVGVRIKGGKKA